VNEFDDDEIDRLDEVWADAYDAHRLQRWPEHGAGSPGQAGIRAVLADLLTRYDLTPKTPARVAAPERVRDPRPGRAPAPEQARPDGGA